MERPRLVVVGGSLAGFRAVEAARRAGFDGHVVLVGEEAHAPYDRPPLSKAFLDDGPEPDVPSYVDPVSSYRDLGVELMLGSPATGLDTASRTVHMGGRSITYDRLVIATGARPRWPAELRGLLGVHTLRTVDDARAVRAALDSGARTVVIGGGFIGAEVATAARKRGLEVTVLEALPTPLVRAVGARMGAVCSALHARNGTTLRCGVTVTGVEGGDRVERVRLSDGSAVDADLVVVGIGAVPATQWLSTSGLALDDGVLCDENLSCGVPGVYAAGDVARWRHPVLGHTLRMENWTGAAEQGAVAGRNAVAAGPPEPCGTVPYFWSDWYGTRIQFVGVPDGARIETFGNAEEGNVTALYHDDDRLTGVLTVGRQPSAVKFRALIRRRASPDEARELMSRRTRRAGSPGTA